MARAGVCQGVRARAAPSRLLGPSARRRVHPIRMTTRAPPRPTLASVRESGGPDGGRGDWPVVDSRAGDGLTRTLAVGQVPDQHRLCRSPPVWDRRR